MLYSQGSQSNSIKTSNFTDKQKLKDFSITKSALQEIVKRKEKATTRNGKITMEKAQW